MVAGRAAERGAIGAAMSGTERVAVRAAVRTAMTEAVRVAAAVRDAEKAATVRLVERVP